MAYAMIILATVAVAMLLLLLVFSRRQRSITPKLPADPIRLTPDAMLQRLKQDRRYRGVKVDAHCRSASKFAGREFDFEEAPSLPVSGCDEAVCSCGYAGLPERRRLGDRRSGLERRLTMRMESTDRRAERPRRKADLSSWAAYQHL